MKTYIYYSSLNNEVLATTANDTLTASKNVLNYINTNAKIITDDYVLRSVINNDKSTVQSFEIC